MMKSVGAALLGSLLVAALFAQASPPGTGRRINAPIAFYDDADVTPPGMVNVTGYYSYTEVEAGLDVAVPATSFSLGLNKRLEVSCDVSRVRSEFQGIRIDGLGDSYLGLKLLLLPEGRRRPALALEPNLEVLGKPSIVNNPLAPDRVNFLLPLLAQKTFREHRVYYTAGYFTRGILFHSLAWELNHWSRVTPTVVLSNARLTRELGLISELGLNRSRSDVLGGLAVAVTPRFSVFANAGRSFGRMDVNSNRYQLTAGLSFNFRLWGER